MEIYRTEMALQQSEQLNIIFSESKKRRVCGRILVVFIVVCSLILVISVGALLYLLLFSSSQDVSEMCLTERCIHTAAKIISSMNKSVDPCQDFYQYACGQWINEQIFQPGQTMIDLDSVMVQELEERMKYLLSHYVDDEPKYKRQVKLFYNSCLNKRDDNTTANDHPVEDSDLIITTIDDVKQRERYCTESTRKLFTYAVNRMYVDLYFSEEDRKYVNEIFVEIFTTILKYLNENIGFSQTTITLVRQVIKSMKAKIGYPKFIMDDDWLKSFYADWPAEEENFQKTLQTFTNFQSKQSYSPVENWVDDVVNLDALYDRKTNSFVLPAGFLQPIVYSGTYTRSMNYGMIGMIIAHEMAHGLQMESVYRNETEWPESDTTQFQSRLMCVVDQYGRFDWHGQQLKKFKSLQENMADTVGLKFSYMAYKNYVIKNGVDVAKLPGLDLNHLQLFFLSFAQMWCDKIDVSAVHGRLWYDDHAPNIFRVVGAVQNSAEFAKVFQCPLGSPMNPFTKCSIY